VPAAILPAGAALLTVVGEIIGEVHEVREPVGRE
jgi:hypothetical protein